MTDRNWAGAREEYPILTDTGWVWRVIDRNPDGTVQNITDHPIEDE